MIVQVNYRIKKPYSERLAIIEKLIVDEIDKRKKVVSLNMSRNERAYIHSSNYDLTSHTCYSCRKPIYSTKSEVVFMEVVPVGSQKTYLHLGCVKQKV